MMSPLFHRVDDSFAILRGRNGVFRQVDVYVYRGHLFARYGGGFIRLYHKGGTSVPAVFLDDLVGVSFSVDSLGRLVRSEG